MLLWASITRSLGKVFGIRGGMVEMGEVDGGDPEGKEAKEREMRRLNGG